MLKRSQSHQIEDRSRIALKAALPRPWVFRDKTPDYGIDGEIEIFDADGASTGLQTLLQLKATAKSTRSLQIRYKVEWITYYLSLDIPVLLVLWVEETNQLLWKWATEVDLFYAKEDAKSLSVSFTNKWTSNTPIEIESTLSFRRDVRAKNVPLPIRFSMTGLVDDTLRAAVKRLFAYAPRLIAYSDLDAQLSCEIRDDEATFFLRGYQGLVFHNWSKNSLELRPKKVVLGLIFALASRGLVDLGVQVWAQVPGLNVAIDDLDLASFAIKVLALAGAADPLRELIDSLLRRGSEELAGLPLNMLYASAPSHRRTELRTLLVTVYKTIANYTDHPIAKSHALTATQIPPLVATSNSSTSER